MVLLFEAGSAATAAYGGLEVVYPITIIEALWSAVAIQRFYQRHLTPRGRNSLALILLGLATFGDRAQARHRTVPVIRDQFLPRYRVGGRLAGP